MRLVVCLPTYDERENLEPMVRALAAALEGIGLEWRVLVVDDASPDGTGELADRLATELPFLEVLHRERKEGLGPAYVAAFEHALAHGADLVGTIDCDFSHDPADLPRLVEAATRVGVGLGSRYVPGGAVRNWGLVRRAVSRGGSLYARAVLRMGVRDPTSGFKVYRREVLETVGAVGARGYAFQVEIVYRALRAGFGVEEVPIVFSDREAGGSKMGAGIVVEAVARVLALRLAALRGRL